VAGAAVFFWAGSSVEEGKDQGGPRGRRSEIVGGSMRGRRKGRKDVGFWSAFFFGPAEDAVM
jgi:hypothetical protein